MVSSPCFGSRAGSWPRRGSSACLQRGSAGTAEQGQQKAGPANHLPLEG